MASSFFGALTQGVRFDKKRFESDVNHFRKSGMESCALRTPNDCIARYGAKQTHRLCMQTTLRQARTVRRSMTSWISLASMR